MTIQDFELNKLKGLVIAEGLTWEEKGEIFDTFCKQFNISHNKLSDMIDKNRQYIDKAVNIYIKFNELTDKEKKTIEGYTDKTKLMLLNIKEPNADKKRAFLVKRLSKIHASDMETIVSIINGNQPYTVYEEQIEKEYKERKAFIISLKKELLYL